MSLTTGLAQSIGQNVAGLAWSLAAGGNVFEDDMPPEPDVAVGVYSSGGLPADSKLPFDSPGIEVIVRGDANPQTAIDLWWAVYDHVHALRYTTLPDGTFLAWALVEQSGPFRIGPDESGRHRFSMNIQAEQRRPSTHRP